jgi:hypothetical protein
MRVAPGDEQYIAGGAFHSRILATEHAVAGDDDINIDTAGEFRERSNLEGGWSERMRSPGIGIWKVACGGFDVAAANGDSPCPR